MSFKISPATVLLFYQHTNDHDGDVEYSIESRPTDGHEVSVEDLNCRDQLVVILRRIGTRRTVRLSFNATLKDSETCILVVMRESSDPRALKYIGAHLQALAREASNVARQASVNSWRLLWPRAEWLKNGWFFPQEGPLMIQYKSYLGKLPSGRLDSHAHYQVVDVDAIRG